MKHFPAVLLGTFVLALSLASLGCGSDSKQPQLGNGPADDVHGVWHGTYIAADGSQSGAFCVKFDQDGRGLTGSIAFDSGASSEVGGVITESNLLFTWGSGLAESPEPAAAADIAGGGTMSGTTSNGAASGTWIAASSAGIHGDWMASHTDAADCG